MSRELLLVHIFHTGAEMGSVRDFMEEAGKKVFGKEGWREHKEELVGFWENLEKAIDNKFGEDLNGVKIYQDGQVVEGSTAVKVTRKIAEKGSKNHQLLLELIDRGATLLKTENFELIKEERRLIKAMTEAESPMEARQAARSYKRRKGDLLRERDEYIAKQIDETLEEGDVGILFIGGVHEVEEKLEPDIEVERLEELGRLASKIRKRIKKLKELSSRGGQASF